MEIGATKVTIKPAMFVLIGSIIFGVVGVVAAGWYALGPRQTAGFANPKRWTYATNSGAEASIKMLSDAGTKELETTREGYSHVDSDEGFQIDISKPGAAPSSVYVRNVIDVDKASNDDLKFTFEAAASQAHPIVFTIRDSQTKTGGTLLWSHSYNIEGDWKTYTETVPGSAIGHGKIQFMVVAGHLGSKPGSISFKHIYLK